MYGIVPGRARVLLLRPALLGLLALFWLSGCASQNEVSKLRRQIWSLHSDLDSSKSQVAKLEKEMRERLDELNNRFEADSQPLRRNQAAVGAQLDRMELELGGLRGQLEEAEAMNARLGERIGEIQQRQISSTLEMQKAIDDLARRMSLVANYLGLYELAASPGTQSEAEKKSKKGDGQTAAQKAMPEAEDAYSKAFQLFRGGQFQEARAGFANYLKRYPKTDLADNAQFWLGECYYAERMYREAIAAYEKTIKNHPKSDKASSALLKQGMAFLELGDKTAAKILLKKVVKGYPESNQARIAQSKLAGIK